MVDLNQTILLDLEMYHGSPGGLAFTVFENSSGFSITKVNNDSYTFNCGSNATLTETGGGMTVTAGPVTQQS